MAEITNTLGQALTVYLAPDVDRTQVARLIDAMCRLNGLVAAVEIHGPAPSAADYERLDRAALDAAFEQGRATPPEAFRR